MVLMNIAFLLKQIAMSAGVPKWRLAEKARREQGRAIVVALSDAQWHEIMQYLQSAPEGARVDYKGTALWYMREWELTKGVHIQVP